MNDEKNKQDESWSPFLLIIAVSAAFYFGGVWVGIPLLIIGIAALGWKKRHEGPFPTNKS